MATWNLAVQWVDGEAPKFRQLAISLAGDIARGRFAIGMKLPSSRALATQLGVHRSTVIAAYRELEADRWITCEAARGTFVAGTPRRLSLLAERAERPTSAGAEVAPLLGYPRAAGYPLDPHPASEPTAPRTPAVLLLLGGVPELRSLPTHLLARAYRQALRGAGARRLLDYGSPLGNVRLRDALADLLVRARGVAAPRESIMVVRGSQQGLYLAARTLIRPGDLVAVEELGYRRAWRALETAGATLVPIPIDRDGLRVDALEAIDRPIRAVYVTPHHHFPTTVTLSAERRRRLLELARVRKMIVLEDDYDHDFHYQGRPVLPLASADRHGNVIYVGTLSKVVAPGLRIGYVVAPPEVVQRLAAYRDQVDTQGDHVTEQAIATLLEDGEIQRHAQRMARELEARRDTLAAELRRRLPQLEFDLPSGGMAIWARAPGVDGFEWARRGLAAGVAFHAGGRFSLIGGAREFVRLGFAACNRVELVEAVDRLAGALPPAGPAPAQAAEQ
jgi:GntR family transcriptional regulator / MocR family aminotransferase